MINAALCIGINKYGHGNDLSGCVNDAVDWSAALVGRGASVATLLDADATRANMLTAMRALATGLGAGQTGVITYSGHGTWMPDTSGDEVDGRDEAICPVDLWDHGVIIDDELHEVFTDRHPTARLIFVSDSCHSGSVNRFADPLDFVTNARRARFLSPGAFLTGTALTAAQQVAAAPTAGLARTSAATLTGCADPEVSYDAWFADPATGDMKANGAFTRVALDALAVLPAGATLAQYHAAIRRRLPSQDYPQHPQLAASRSQKRWPAL